MNGPPPRFAVRQMLSTDDQMLPIDEVSGMHFEIERDGVCLAFDLSEAEALAVARAILGVSIQIRDGSGTEWQPRLIEGGLK
jgi:hypothetical protein